MAAAAALSRVAPAAARVARDVRELDRHLVTPSGPVAAAPREEVPEGPPSEGPALQQATEREVRAALRGGPATLSEIAAHTSGDTAAVRRALARLSRAGSVRRVVGRPARWELR